MDSPSLPITVHLPARTRSYGGNIHHEAATALSAGGGSDQCNNIIKSSRDNGARAI